MTKRSDMGQNVVGRLTSYLKPQGSAMRIIPVPCLKDNYAYLVVCETTGRTAVVDPSEAEPVQAAANRLGLTIDAIWNTHHHHDHVGGNQPLVATHPGIEVVAHASDRGRVPAQTLFIEEG